MRTESTEDPTSPTRAKRRFYAQFDLDNFQKRVEVFWHINFANSTNHVVEEVERVLRVNDEYVFPFYWKEYLPSTPFFRVRAVPQEQLSAGLTESDLWEPPQHLTPSGRLNLPKESLLYTALEKPNALMHEVGLVPGDSFILVKYNLVEPIFFKTVEKTDVDENLEPHEKLIEEAITSFVRSVLVIPADHFGQATYAVTQQLLRHFYPLAPEESGWTYESTQKSEMINAAITPKSAHASLTTTVVLAGRMHSIDENDDVLAEYVGYSNGQARWGENIGWEYFPNTGLKSLEDYVDWAEQEH